MSKANYKWFIFKDELCIGFDNFVQNVGRIVFKHIGSDILFISGKHPEKLWLIRILVFMDRFIFNNFWLLLMWSEWLIRLKNFS